MGAGGGRPAKLPKLPLLGPSPEGTEPDPRKGGPFMLGEGDCSGDAEGDRSCRAALPPQWPAHSLCLP